MTFPIASDPAAGLSLPSVEAGDSSVEPGDLSVKTGDSGPSGETGDGTTRLANHTPLRLIQVGAGGMGRAWLSTIAASTDVELVGLVDLDLDVARSAAAEAGLAGVPLATSLTDLVASTGAEAVVNVTVPKAHHVVNVTAMRSGLAVLCEKPLSESVSQCLSMIAASELTGQLLMVSQSRRYWRHLSAFRRLLAELGPVGILTCEFFKAPHFGGFREVMAEPLLIDMAIHQFDLARHLIGSNPVSVYCESYNPSWSWFSGHASAEAVFTFADDQRFSFTGSWCSPGAETSWNGSWRASTGSGTALWDGDRAPTAARGEEDLVTEIGDEPEQIAGSLAEFVAAVRNQTVPSGEAHSNVQSVLMVEEAYAQALAEESSDDVRRVLAGWSSVHRALASVPA